MILTSSLMFHMLARTYELHVLPSDRDNLPVATLRPLRSVPQTDSEKIPVGFYLCKVPQLSFDAVREGSVFLFLGDPQPILLPPGCNAAFLMTEDSEENIVYQTSEISRKLQEWDLTFKNATVNRTDLSLLMKTAHEILPYPLSIVDRNYEVPAYIPSTIYDNTKDYFTRISPTKMKAHFSVISELLLEPAFEETFKKEDAFLYYEDREDTLLCMNIFENGQYLARIICVIGKAYDPGVLHMFRHICDAVKTVFLRYTDDILVKRQNDRIHTLLSNLVFVHQTESIHEMTTILPDYGWDKNHAYQVIVLRFSEWHKMKHIHFYLTNQLEMQWDNSFAIRTESEIVWVINKSLSRELSNKFSVHQALSYILRDLVCKAGISREEFDLTKIHLLYKQAVFSLEQGMKTREHFWYFLFEDYAMDYLLREMKTVIVKENLYHDGIRRLLSYDEKKNTQLTATLTAFILNNFNATSASEQLFMHRSTFNRQMQKIEQITGVGWHDFRDFNEVIHALITLKLHERI